MLSKVVVDQLLYKAPPVAESLRLGRAKESDVVDKYVQTKREDECLVSVQETGLHVHVVHGFLAASPDRFVNDTSSEPSSGLLEVKYPVSVSGHPESGIISGKSCLEKVDGIIRLNRGHNYFYQVQGQMACTGRPWCDFACMFSTGDIFIERGWFDAGFWDGCFYKLRQFYDEFFCERISLSTEAVNKVLYLLRFFFLFFSHLLFK